MERMRIDEFAGWRYVNSVRVAPGGERLVYSVIGVDLGRNRYTNDLWMLDVATGAQRRLTSSGKEGRFDFTDDGGVLFVSRRTARDGASDQDKTAVSGHTGTAGARTEAEAVALARGKAPAELAEDPARGCDLYRIAPDGGEAVPYLHIPLTVADWKQLPEGRLLVRARELADASSPYVALEDIPFWENGDTYTSGLRWGLYLVEPPEESEGALVPPTAQVRRLTAAGESVDDYALSADRTRAYLLSSTYQGRMPLTNRASALDLATGEARPMGPEDMSFKLIELVDDGTLMLLGTDMARHGINEDPHVFLMGTDGTGYRRVSGEGFDVDFYNHVTTDARQGGGRTTRAVGGMLYCANVEGDASRLSRIGTDGTIQPLVTGAGSLDSFDTLDGSALYYVAMRPNCLPEVYRTVVDPSSGQVVGAETRLTDFSAALEGRPVVAPEQFDFESNGAVLRGYVVKPADWKPGEKRPGILWVHGGPKCVMGDVLFHEIQFLSGLGYFVFYTNPHGSGGHGIEYAASIFGGYGGIDFQDLMAFTDAVLERYPDVDPDRLAEMGGSYGGFMTNWVIGHTDRFACCVSQRSISNWVSMFGVADIGYHFAGDQTHGWPWGETDGVPSVAPMWDQSPLKYADRVTTPTLFLHSDADYRCPLEQGMQMYTALQLHGVPTRMVVFKGENHELSRSGKPQGRVRRLTEIADWCARWLKGEEDGEPALRPADGEQG